MTKPEFYYTPSEAKRLAGNPTWEKIKHYGKMVPGRKR